MYCPNCACELPAIAQFCVRCGAKTGFGPAGSGTHPSFPPPVSKQNAGGDQTYCGRCGAKAIQGNQFCTKCGIALPANNAPEHTASSAQSIPADLRMAVSPNVAQIEEPTNGSPCRPSESVETDRYRNTNRSGIKKRFFSPYKLSGAHLQEAMRSKSDQELRCILESRSGEFTEDATKAAEIEAKLRNLNSHETDHDTPAQISEDKKRLVTSNAWSVISIISLLMAFSNASKNVATGPGEFIPVLIGGFIGGLVLFGGGWAIIVLASRWLSRWISRLSHNHPNSHSTNQQPPHLSSPPVKRFRLRAYWLVPLAVVVLLSIWAFSSRDTHFVTGPAAPAETVSRITITGTLPNVVVLDGSNEASNDRYRFEGSIHNDSSSEISFIRMRIRIYACGGTPQPEDVPLTQEATSRCTQVGESVKEVYAHIGPGETADFGNFYFPERPENYGWSYDILRVETPSGG